MACEMAWVSSTNFKGGLTGPMVALL